MVINENHKKLRDKYGGLVEHADELPAKAVVIEKFCTKLGGCYNNLTRSEQDNILHTLRQMKNVARMHRGRTSTSPDGREVQEPAFLLVIARYSDLHRGSEEHDAATMNDLEAYVVCQVSLCPLDFCLSQCSLSKFGAAPMCQDVACPKTFTATLEYTVCRDFTGDGSQTIPCILTVHQFAYRRRATGISNYKLMLFSNYEVMSLNIVQIQDAESCLGVHSGGNRQSAVNDEDDEEGSHQEDPCNEMILKCMSILKQKPQKTRSKSTRTASDEPRLRPPAASSSRARKQTTARQAECSGDRCDAYILLHTDCMLHTHTCY